MGGESAEIIRTPAMGSCRGRGSPLLWLNLLSLDAPAVAVLWQLLFARCFQVRVSPAVTVSLGLIVWLIYVADRLLDIRTVPEQGLESRRHSFYRNHWRGILLPAFAVLTFAAWITMERLDRVIFAGGLLLALGVGAYFILVHSGRSVTQPVWPKEALVAILFVAGTCFPVAELLPSNRLIIAPFILFAILCWINCAGIEHLEWTRLRASRFNRPHPWTVLLGRHLIISAFAALLFALGGLFFTVDSRLGPLFAAGALSAAGFVVLKYRSESFSSDRFRVLMDIVLFTPILFLPFL